LRSIQQFAIKTYGCHYYLFQGIQITDCTPTYSLPLPLDKSYAITYHHYTASQRRNNMATISASEARSRLYRLIDETASSHEPVLITGKRANAVLVSEEDWKAMQETMYLLSVPGMRESIKEGLNTPVEECAKDLDW